MFESLGFIGYNECHLFSLNHLIFWGQTFSGELRHHRVRTGRYLWLDQKSKALILLLSFFEANNNPTGVFVMIWWRIHMLKTSMVSFPGWIIMNLNFPRMKKRNHGNSPTRSCDADFLRAFKIQSPRWRGIRGAGPLDAGQRGDHGGWPLRRMGIVSFMGCGGVQTLPKNPWLVVWLPSILFSHMAWVAVIIPIDELIFFRGVESTKQIPSCPSYP